MVLMPVVVYGRGDDRGLEYLRVGAAWVLRGCCVGAAWVLRTYCAGLRDAAWCCVVLRVKCCNVLW